MSIFFFVMYVYPCVCIPGKKRTFSFCFWF